VEANILESKNDARLMSQKDDEITALCAIRGTERTAAVSMAGKKEISIDTKTSSARLFLGLLGDSEANGRRREL
jgi:hypothetical protein